MNIIFKLALRVALAMTAVTLAVAAMTAGSALASPAPGPHWAAISMPVPTWFHPGEIDFYEIGAINDGAAATIGTITLTDTLPAGVTFLAATGAAEQSLGDPSVRMQCAEASSGGTVTVTCKTSASVPADQLLAVKILVKVSPDMSEALSNLATISGGGASPVKTESATPVTPASQVAPFGVSAVSDLVQADGAIDTQAGSHPYGYTTLLAFNSATIDPKESCDAEFASTGDDNPVYGCAVQSGGPRDVEVTLPPGTVGDPTAVPRCTQQQFQSTGAFGCPAASQVGFMKIDFYNVGKRVPSQTAAVYNVAPPPGQAAEFGFSVSTIGHVAMLFHVHPLPGGGYALTSTVSQITEFFNVEALALTIWGVPAEESHTPLRSSEIPGESCLGGSFLNGGCVSHAVHTPFVTLPTSCSDTPLEVGFGVDSWQDPSATSLPVLAETELPAMTGCEALSLRELSLRVEPSTQQAGVPSGYGVHLSVPQNEEPEGLATPDVRNVEVTLPEGTVVSPSAANGLVACTDAQFDRGGETIGKCPVQSRIGTVKIVSPLIDTPITGNVFVGEPECSPCSGEQAAEGKLVKVLIEAKLPNPHEAEMSQAELETYKPPVLIKLAGHTRITQATGQLTTVFTGNPQLPFSELEVALENGPGAPFVNPDTCGPIVASANLTPWSGTTPTNISSPGVSLTGCSAPGFSPSFTAGMTGSAYAGAFSPLSFTLTRPDGQQALGGVTLHLPPGLAGLIAKVVQCGEAQANSSTCPAASEIGSDTVAAGPGSQPVTIGGGKVFLTGPYKGAPFGLSIVTPAAAGPFTLAGNTGTGTQVVRAAVSVDPSTAAVTVTSDPLPTVLDGIPLDIQKVIVNVNRQGFMFNPTNCDAMSIAGTVTSNTGTQSSSSYPFQAANCAALPFRPSFTASTQGKTSRQDGASLDVKVGSTAGQANIHKVHVTLPRALPSRQSTLNQACQSVVFSANPGACPAGSNMGTASANTPILTNPLTGPAYLVSHGGAAFPNLEIVLQGEGITLILDGKTDITNGITSSTFEAVPDAPINSFELTLPEGPHSILGAPGNKLCTEKLTMPTTITGQNGAQIEQATKITVTGCAKTKTLTRAQKLTQALKACHKDKNKGKRATCEKQARKHYGAIKKIKKK